MVASEHSTESSPRQIASRAVFSQALPVGILCFLLAACAGFLPPWPICLTLFLSATAAWAFHAVQRNRLAIAVCTLGVLATVVLLWPRVSIRAATSADKTYERYFGGPHDDFSARNIAVATGTFTLGTWLTGELYHLHDGQFQELNGFSVGRSPNQIGAPHWVDMRITLALIQYDTEHGTVTQLGSAGHSRGGGGSSEIPTSVKPLHSRFIGGQLLSGQSRILYIEGDTEFQLSSGMTVEEFAKENEGSFYVVVIGMH